MQLDRQTLNNRPTVSSVIWTVCSPFGLKAVVKIPDAASRTLKEYDVSSPEALVTNVEGLTDPLGITLSKQELRAIAKEVKAHPKEIADTFSEMIKALALSPQ